MDNNCQRKHDSELRLDIILMWLFFVPLLLPFTYLYAFMEGGDNILTKRRLYLLHCIAWGIKGMLNNLFLTKSNSQMKITTT